MQSSIKTHLAIFTFLGGTIYTFQKLQITLPKFINNYFNDFLITPITLLLSLLIVRKLRNDNTHTISIGIIIYTAALYSFLFEYLLPKHIERYTTDFIDVILYFIGGFTFWLIQTKTK